jgi:hypothetical protein
LKNVIGILMVISLYLLTGFGSMDILIMLIFLVHEHGRSFIISFIRVL